MTRFWNNIHQVLYAQSLKMGKPNKVFGSKKIKGPKQYSKKIGYGNLCLGIQIYTNKVDTTLRWAIKGHKKGEIR